MKYIFSVVFFILSCFVVSCMNHSSSSPAPSRAITHIDEQPSEPSQMEILSRSAFENADQARRVRLVMQCSEEIESSLRVLRLISSGQGSLPDGYAISPDLSKQIDSVRVALFSLRTRYSVEVLGLARHPSDHTVLSANAFEEDLAAIRSSRDNIWLRFIEENNITDAQEKIYPINLH